MRVGLRRLCKEYGYSRQAKYRRDKYQSKRQAFEKRVLAMVRECRAVQPKVGAKKLWLMVNSALHRQGLSIGRDRLFDLLRKHKLFVTKHRKSVRTTDSYHRFRTYPNLIRNMIPTKPNQIWVSDITYIATMGKFCYLFLITDLYSRKIVGYHLSKHLGVEGAIAALNMAMAQAATLSGIIHHSDRGFQYCCNAYVKRIKRKKMTLSMTEKNHCYENAVAERVNGILKDEFNLSYRFRCYVHARAATISAIRIYNEVRLHTSLGYVTPCEKYEEKTVNYSRT